MSSTREYRRVRPGIGRAPKRLENDMRAVAAARHKRDLSAVFCLPTIPKTSPMAEQVDDCNLSLFVRSLDQSWKLKTIVSVCLALTGVILAHLYVLLPNALLR